MVVLRCAIFTTSSGDLGSDIVLDSTEDKAGNIWFYSGGSISKMMVILHNLVFNVEFKNDLWQHFER